MFRFVLFTAIFSLFSLTPPSSAGEPATPTFTISKVFTTRGGVHTTPGGTIRLMKGVPTSQGAIKDTDSDIMFSSTGPPKKTSGLGPGPANITDVLVDGENCRGAHVTTRPHNRKVVYHEPSGNWFVFYGTGHWFEAGEDYEMYSREMIAWRSSKDGGRSWSELEPAIVGNGHSSSTDVILVGDRIFATETRWGYWREEAGIPWLENGKAWYRRSSPDQVMFYVPFEVFPFDIAGGRLVRGQEAEALPGDAHVGHAGPHYGSMTRDTSGYLWVAARASADAKGMATWVSRTVRPDDITAWEPHTVLFKSAGPGTHAPQVIALDEGRVACVLFAQHEQTTAVYLYDPDSGIWSVPQIIGKGYKSKRASAVFDPGSRRLHVVYTDAVGDARHRALRAPYRPADWSPPLDEPGALVAEKAGVNKGDDDLSLSADLSRNPAPLALVHRGPDLRLHLRYYDGQRWSPKDVKVGLQDPAWTCDEASAVADFSHGLAFVYWCQWKDPEVKKGKNNIGQLRFSLVQDMAALFAAGTGMGTVVQEEHTAALPQTLILGQNYPNPFNSNSVIPFSLPRDEEVELTLYDLTGQKVATLAQGTRQAGMYTVHWDGRNDSGNEVASAIYLYHLRTGAQKKTRKLLLLR